MAAASALSTSLATIRPIGRAAGNSSATKVVCLSGINNNATSSVLSPQISSDQCFGNRFMSIKAAPGSNKKRGSVFSTRSAATEIFNIASIMCGLTLVGVALGFVLLRIESSVEEAAE